MIITEDLPPTCNAYIYYIVVCGPETVAPPYAVPWRHPGLDCVAVVGTRGRYGEGCERGEEGQYIPPRLDSEAVELVGSLVFASSLSSLAWSRHYGLFPEMSDSIAAITDRKKEFSDETVLG